MDENKNLQPELSPEEQLDQLLAQFLDEPDLELPAEGETTAQLPAELAEESATAPEPAAQMPEEPVAEPIVEPESAQAVSTEPVMELPAENLEEPAAESGPEVEAVLLPTQVHSMPLLETEEGSPVETAPVPAEEAQITAFEDTWIGELMDVPMVTEEIGPDEQAVAAAGLVHPEDQEFVDILQEVQDEQQPEEAPEEQDILPVIPPETEPAAEQPQPEEILEIKEPEEMAKNIPAEEILEGLPVEEEPLPPQKRRPKKKGSYGFFSLPHLAATIIWLAIIVFIGVSLGNILWEYTADMLAFGRPDSIVTITIAEDDDLEQICDKLQSTGLIKYPSLFKLYAGLSDAMEDINPGTYKLNTLLDYNALVDAMSGYSTRVSVNVTIPEGYNCAQIFQLLEDKGVSTVSALQEAAAKVDPASYWFLEGVSSDNQYWLEGYLFPDTYTFYLNHEPDGVMKKLLSNFDKRLTESMRAQLPILNETLSEMMRKNGLSETYIAAHQLTLRDVVIVASMIEKEAAHTTEGYIVASVIYNRLTNPNAHPYLQIDATLVYVTGHNVLTMEDLNLDNPYNTYKYPGLVPGPITNPSQASLSAALDPDSTNYYYYALNPATGDHKFSETLAEHEAFLDSLRNNEG